MKLRVVYVEEIGTFDEVTLAPELPAGHHLADPLKFLAPHGQHEFRVGQSFDLLGGIPDATEVLYSGSPFYPPPGVPVVSLCTKRVDVEAMTEHKKDA